MLSYRGAESRKCDFVTDYLSNRNYYLMSRGPRGHPNLAGNLIYFY